MKIVLFALVLAVARYTSAAGGCFELVEKLGELNELTPSCHSVDIAILEAADKSHCPSQELVDDCLQILTPIAQQMKDEECFCGVDTSLPVSSQTQDSAIDKYLNIFNIHTKGHHSYVVKVCNSDAYIPEYLFRKEILPSFPDCPADKKPDTCIAGMWIVGKVMLYDPACWAVLEAIGKAEKSLDSSKCPSMGATDSCVAKIKSEVFTMGDEGCYCDMASKQDDLAESLEKQWAGKEEVGSSGLRDPLACSQLANPVVKAYFEAAMMGKIPGACAAISES